MEGSLAGGKKLEEEHPEVLEGRAQGWGWWF